MKWTDEKPSKPGWYWFRNENWNRSIVFLYQCNAGICFDFGEGNAVPLGIVSGQWSDTPIPEPEEG